MKEIGEFSKQLLQFHQSFAAGKNAASTSPISTLKFIVSLMK